jgi:hypothetical protein
MLKFIVKNGSYKVKEFPTKGEAETFKESLKGKKDEWGTLYDTGHRALHVVQGQDHSKRWRVEFRCEKEKVGALLTEKGFEHDLRYNSVIVTSVEAVTLLKGIKVFDCSLVERAEELDFQCLDCGEFGTTFHMNQDYKNYDTHMGICHGCYMDRVRSTFACFKGRRLPVLRQDRW